MKSMILTVILSLTSVVLLTGLVIGYNTMDQKIGDLAIKNSALATQVTDLQAETTVLTETTEATESELLAYKQATAAYFGTSKEVGVTLNELKNMHMSFSNSKSPSTLKKFESTLVELKQMGADWESLLEENRESYEEMGIDVDEDINQMKTTLPLVEKSLTEMKAAL